MAAGGYPVKYEKELISGLEKFDINNSNNKISFTGVKRRK